MENLLSTKEAAEFLGVSVKTIKRWRKSGHLVPSSTRDNGYSLYSMSLLNEFLHKLGTSKTGDIGEYVPTSIHNVPSLQSGDIAPVATRANCTSENCTSPSVSSYEAAPTQKNQKEESTMIKFTEYIPLTNDVPISGACLADFEEKNAELKLTAPPPTKTLSKEEVELIEIAKAHIELARLNIDKLPENQRRGLSIETLKYFGCGYMTDWVHPKYCVRGKEAEFNRQNRQRRIIIPTPNHYNAVMLDRDRSEANREWHKMHTKGIELFNENALLGDADIIVVVEGEFDAMSIWQASKGTVAVVGCSGGEKKYLLNALGKLGIEGKKFLILFDDDKKADGSNPGQEHAAALMDALIRLEIPAVNHTFNEFMTADELKTCADSKGKIDANQILQRRGDEFLNQVLKKIQDASRADFEAVAQKIAVDKEARKNSLKSAAKNNSPLRPSKGNSARTNIDVKNLLAEINSITADALENRGYLEHTDKGGKRPNGYVCPFCGSGTHEDKSGALSFYEDSAGNHFCCHACGEGGDVVKFLARVYGKSTEGKEFLEVLKQAADEFGIKYDAAKLRISRRNAENQARSRLEELKNAADTPENREEIRKEIWRLAERSRDKKGNPTSIKATVANLDLIFDNDKALQGLIGYNEFFREMSLLKNAPWRNRGEDDEWTDRDEAQLQIYLARQYCELHGQEKIHNMVIDVSQRNAFHEVKDFFNGLPKWDGVGRAAELFIKFLHADDTPFVREVTLNWLTAAVARIFYPGCDYQLAPILLGEQGIGKSYLLNKLGGKFYGALMDDVGDSHAIDAIQRLWLVEVKEMASMKKDVDANKRFIDNAVDVRRAAYARYATASKRHCVFIVTTNNKMMLSDVTGNRRYPVIECNAKTGEYEKGLTEEFIQQVWAEVYFKFKEKFAAVKGIADVGSLLELSRETKLQVLTKAEEHTRDDGLTSEIKAFLDTKIPAQIIWHLLSREERRKYFVDGGKIELELEDIEARFKNHAGKKFADLQPEFLEACEVKDGYVRQFTVGDRRHLSFYGSELRQHVCATEIFNECFGSDRRKSMNRIAEILASLENWERGERIQGNDSAYRDMKVVYYRV